MAIQPGKGQGQGQGQGQQNNKPSDQDKTKRNQPGQTGQKPVKKQNMPAEDDMEEDL